MAQSPNVRPWPVRVARWLLPWLSVLAFSTGLAFAANTAMVATWSQQQPIPAKLPPSEARWVSIVLTSGEGARFGVRCLAPPELFSSDTVSMDVRDFDSVAADICLQLEARGSA